MKRLKPKIALVIMGFIGLMFFSNNFGIIDIEKTAIITAIAIDYDGEEYEISAQIAVPQASNTTTENQRTQVSAKGKTVASAIKKTASESGWYPQLIFCNLIILGDGFAHENVVTVLDYFSKTYRVQDSAQVVTCNGKATDLLKTATPLDNISSFAIQKILLKNPGFDKDVCANDIKNFCTGYYSIASSSYMPIVKTSTTADNGVGSQGENSGNGGTGGSQNKQDSHTVFDATVTALFANGKKVGELDGRLTYAYNLLSSDVNGSTFTVENVPDENGKPSNFLLSIMSHKSKVRVNADKDNLIVDIRANLYCKISDQTSEYSHNSLAQNAPLSKAVKERAENALTTDIINLFKVTQNTKCDMLKIKEKLYRFNFKQYSAYKDNYLDKAKLNVTVTVNGQL